MTKWARMLSATTALLCVVALFSARAVPSVPDGRGDATVIAVIDTGISPYHWDFLSSKMPQETDNDPANDLPLSTPPHEWIPGFPAPGSFAAYDSLDLTLDGTDPDRSIAELSSFDDEEWAGVRSSGPGAINYYWVPRTKVVGALTFGGGVIRGAPSTHGQGSASVSAGNFYGTCPECLLVFIQYGGREAGEAAIAWAESQPWIDAITNSYGFSLVSRDRIYSGSDTQAQLAATERGQTVFFSAGNGQDGGFLVPNTTYLSSQEGLDWIITVGAGQPSNGSTYLGAGKPADVTGMGTAYPAAYGGVTVTGEGRFGGTSNATPTVAGLYGRALYRARTALSGASKTQTGGVVAIGDPFPCGPIRLDCELGDGVLTADELRRRLLHGAVHTQTGQNVAGRRTLPVIGEEEFWGEGHGTYFARVNRGHREDEWLAEFDRIVLPMEGAAGVLTRPAGEREWMVVDSWCRQHLWGSWSGGYYVDGATALPEADPTAPARSSVLTACPHLPPQH